MKNQRNIFTRIPAIAFFIAAAIIFTCMSMEIISLQNSTSTESSYNSDFKRNKEGVSIDTNINSHLSPRNTTASLSKTSAISMSPDEFQNFKIESKQFEIFGHPFPCLHKNNTEPGTGFRYIKVYKTASSTVAHIVKYIADKRGSCKEFSNHAAAHEFSDLHGWRRTKNQHKSFLFTFVREPTKRAVSDFFYTRVTQGGKDVNLSNFKEGCCRPQHELNGQSGFQLAYISTDERLPEYTFWHSDDPLVVQKPYLLKQRVNNVFESYDFVGVSDRLNESLVALSFLLDLDLTEIVYVSYRESGSFEAINKKCIKLVKAEVTPDIEEYLKTDEWKAITAGDKLLHRTANDALDNTINNVIGRDKFEERLLDYEDLVTFMKACGEECSSACTTDGEYRGETSCRPCMTEKRKQWKGQRMMA